MLSDATIKYYRGLWAQLRSAKGLAEADRKPLHAALGLPDAGLSKVTVKPSAFFSEMAR
jgi:hypothetical protein